MTLVEREGVRLRAHNPSRQSGYEPVYAKRGINHPSASTVVPTRQLAAAVEEILSEIAGDQPDDGELSVLAARASRRIKMSEAAIVRRLWEIRKGRSRATGAELAGALLVSGNLDFKDAGVLELPAGFVAAKERIEVYLELRGQEMSKRDIAELAEDLLEFARCCIHGPGDELAPQSADIVAELEGEVVLIDFKTADTLPAEQLELWEAAS